jgi:hydrogenase nickel incorporation protein HypB
MSTGTSRTIEVKREVQQDQRQEAEALRRQLGAKGTLVVNLVSSPGAGKTSLLEATARHMVDRVRMAVLVGDIATERDADRLRPYVPVQQLTTGGACHLEIGLVKRGLALLPDEPVDFLFIENIGNLVCPASHDLAEHRRVVLMSTTEGDDKPAKYPKMFRTSHAMLISKCDLLPYVPFSIDAVTKDARNINGQIDVIRVASLSGDGIEAWCQWLQDQRRMLMNGALH